MYKILRSRTLGSARLALTVAPLLVLLAVHSLHAEISSIGDVNPVDIDPLGYGIPGQPDSIGGDLIIGEDYLGGIFIDVAFDSGPLINDGDGIVGQNEGSYGAMSIDGFPSDWLMSGDLIIGDAGTGKVDMFDSASIQVGETAQGTSPLDIVAGAGITTLGARPTGIGQLNLDAIATRLVTARLVVGDLGQGNINLSDGAAMYTAEAILGNLTDSDGSGVGIVSLSDTSTRWTVGNTETESILTIGNGDDVDNQAAGTLLVSNGASVQVSDTVEINFNGRVELSTGGQLKTLPSSPTTQSISNNGVIIGDGHINFVGHTLINGDSSRAGTRGYVGEIRNAGNKVETDFATNQREKLVFNGDQVINNGVIESLGGEMEFYAPVDNTVDGDIITRDAVLRFHEGLTNDGELAFGGETTVYGDITSSNSFFVLSDSDLLVRGDVTFTSAAIAAFTVGDSPGFMDVVGAVDLGDSFLSLDYSGGVGAQPGDSYDIINASDGVTGTFSNTQASADGLLWDITYGLDSVTVTATNLAALPIGADFNGDGIVNSLDLDIWRMYSGAMGAPGSLASMGDADGDGDVDGVDYLIIQRRWGMPGALVAATGTVPEPRSCLLLLSAVLWIPARKLA